MALRSPAPRPRGDAGTGIEGVGLRLAEASIRRPRRAITALVLVTLAAAPGLARLELRTDGHALVPADSPAVRFDREVRERFNLRDPIVVALESSHPDGIYNPTTLRKVRRLTEALAALPGVGAGQLMSLATERRQRTYQGTWKFRPFLDPLPETPELLAEVRSDVEATAVLEGTLVSADGRATALLVGVPPSFGLDADGVPRRFFDRMALYRRILDTIQPFADSQDQILVAGAPAAESLLGHHILEDLVWLVPLALAMVGLVLWLGCRRPWGVMLGLTEAGACLIFTFGLMGWMAEPVYLTTAVLPVILIAIGLADEIHIFWHFQRLPEELSSSTGSEPPAAVQRTMAEMARPVILTSLTTALGFLSFLTSPIRPVASFGTYAAAGILFCMVWSLTVIPAALSLLPAPHPRPSRGQARGDAKAGSWAWRWLASLLERRRPILVALGLVSLTLALGVPRLFIQDGWIDGFAPESPFRRATERIHELFDGTHVLLVELDFDLPREEIPEVGSARGPLLDPARLEAVGALESFLRGRPEVGGVLGLHSHLSTVAYLWGGRRDAARAIPRDPRGVFLLLSRFATVRGLERRQQVVDDAFRRTVVTVLLQEANYRDTATLMDAIQEHARTHLKPLGARLGFAGDVAVSQSMIPAIVRTQVLSLLLALAFAGVVIGWLDRSRLGLLAVAPAAVAVLWVFGLMGWLGIPLGVATSMFCAITLGVGVDYGIHFTTRFRRASAAGRPRPILTALEQAGPAILADTLAIGLGFGLLALSGVPANQRLGLLVALALAAGSLLTLVGLGAWLTVPTGHGLGKTSS